MSMKFASKELRGASTSDGEDGVSSDARAAGRCAAIIRKSIAGVGPDLASLQLKS